MTTTLSSKEIQHLNTLRWRCIGPPRGGRVVAVAGDPFNSQVFYFGAAAGGIWKTEDGEHTGRMFPTAFWRVLRLVL